MELEEPDPSIVSISITPAVEVTPGSPVLDLLGIPDDSDVKSALNKMRLKNIGRLTISFQNMNSSRLRRSTAA